ncbi:Leu/Phe/Val dehydrogenase [Aquisediminimonas profunda]|uniref:Leu/Phe/Val dehydrogenase n=1 Tax=Aquisediminimonas profunda TaxID=1550733 RepID=UPI001C62B7B4|nr:Glu/Leu/Phe/Val dehydrogenase dimerization domain-containing protein [Aquisediminimonas profunda]
MTSPWDMPDFDDHEALHLIRDAKAGLSAIIAIHSTHLGPAGGGTRFWHYLNNAAAITDALRLSRGMSYKNAMAGLAMGGGKAVILSDAAGTKTPELIAAFAKAVDSLGGRYVTAQDVGMSAADMIAISQGTRYVSGLPPKDGGAGGDPGPSTAMGVFLGIKAAVRRALGKEDLAGVHIAIQGVGSVGGGVARHAAAAGARITLADRNGELARKLADDIGAQIVPVDEIMSVESDVFSPCALGAILTESSIAALRTAIVAGGANNQLATQADGDRLQARGILYAPDYVINAGGIINVALEYLGNGDRAAVNAKVLQIPDRLNAVWDGSEASGQNPARVADAMAQRLIGRG